MIGERSRLLNCLTAIESAQRFSNLPDIILQIRDLYEFSNIAFHVVRLGDRSGTNPLLLLTYPTEWTQLYIKNDYFQIDPVVRISKTRFLPVDWSELPYDSPAINAFFRKANSYEKQTRMRSVNMASRCQFVVHMGNGHCLQRHQTATEQSG